VKTQKAMELAATQHGLLTLAQARALGALDDEIEYRISTRVLVPVHPGVYRFASAPRSWHQRLLGACLGVGSPSAVSHRSAAAMHGLWSMTEEIIEVTVGRDRSPELAGVVSHRLADLGSRWTMSIDGIPVTTPARVLVDLGAVETLGNVARILDRAVGRQLVSLGEVRSAMNAVARKGRAGVGVIRRLLDERGVATRSSVLEARMASLFSRFGLPAPVSEHSVFDGHGGFIARVDFAYPELKYAIEVDGYSAHSDLRAFRHDRSRQNDLIDLGWTVHRFTASDVEQHPTRVAFRIAERHARLLGTLTRNYAG
jgi:hypothetical protein